MISKRQDFCYLLDNLRDLSRVYSLDFNGDVINKNGEKEDNERIKASLKFYIIYCLAYRKMDEYKEQKPLNDNGKETIERALASYGMFNYFINTCIGEYAMYDDIGTGNVTYIPYQPLADFFFEDYVRKELLLDYLKHELQDVFENDGVKKRVKK